MATLLVHQDGAARHYRLHAHPGPGNHRQPGLLPGGEEGAGQEVPGLVMSALRGHGRGPPGTLPGEARHSTQLNTQQQLIIFHIYYLIKN